MSFLWMNKGVISASIIWNPQDDSMSILLTSYDKSIVTKLFFTPPVVTQKKCLSCKIHNRTQFLWSKVNLNCMQLCNYTLCNSSWSRTYDNHVYDTIWAILRLGIENYACGKLYCNLVCTPCSLSIKINLISFRLMMVGYLSSFALEIRILFLNFLLSSALDQKIFYWSRGRFKVDMRVETLNFKQLALKIFFAINLSSLGFASHGHRKSINPQMSSLYSRIREPWKIAQEIPKALLKLESTRIMIKKSFLCTYFFMVP